MKKVLMQIFLLISVLLILTPCANAEKKTIGIYTIDTITSSTAKLLEVDDSTFVGTPIKSLYIDKVGTTSTGIYQIVSVGTYAFLNLNKISEVELPYVTTLEAHSMAGVSKATFSSKLKNIAEGAFACPKGNAAEKVTSITFSSTNSNFIIENGVLYNKAKTQLIHAMTPADDFVVPGTVTKICNYAFSFGNTYPINSIKTLTIPSSVKTIGEYAFYSCDDLQSVNFPYGLTSIGDYAFYSTALTSVTLPNSVTSIGNYAFARNYSLTSITLPQALTEIKDGAFYDCVFTSLTIPDSVTSIGSFAFSSCNYLTNVILPQGLRYIYSNAFSNCDAFTEIAIPDSVIALFGYAFNSCDNLKKVTLSKNITILDHGTFKGCTALTDITIPDSITFMNSEVFMNCTALEEITIPESIPIINTSAFEGCSSLKSVKLHNKLEKIYGRAFTNCKALESIDIPDSVISLGYSSFSGCSSLKSVDLPNSITEIGSSAFSGCSSLSSINLPDNITGIYYGTFSGCKALENVILPSKITLLDEYSFSGCTSLKTITIPANVTEIRSNAFNNCTALTDVYFNNTKEVWDTITIDNTKNESLLNATIHYYVGNVYFCVTPEATSDSVNMYTEHTVTVPLPEGRLGYEFLGWATTPDAAAAEYSSGDALTADDVGKTLYGMWARTVYTTTTSSYGMLMITPTGIDTGNTITLAAYKDNNLVFTKTNVYTGGIIPVLIDTDYDTIKILSWASLNSMQPLCSAEIPDIQ